MAGQRVSHGVGGPGRAHSDACPAQSGCTPSHEEAAGSSWNSLFIFSMVFSLKSRLGKFCLCDETFFPFVLSWKPNLT